jgi:hypothetical protein
MSCRFLFFKNPIFVFLALFGAILAFVPCDGWALQSQEMNLSEIVQEADRIVVGKVISAVESAIPGPGGGTIPIMEYTLLVSNAIKGTADARIVIRHVRLPGVSFFLGNESGTGVGLPTYKVDEAVVLFLTGESQLGLSSPVGLLQGAFRVESDKQGQPVSVVNGVGNAGLMMGTDSANPRRKMAQGEGVDSSSTPKGGPVSYSVFISTVKGMVNQK